MRSGQLNMKNYSVTKSPRSAELYARGKQAMSAKMQLKLVCRSLGSTLGRSSDILTTDSL
jgi:hypothetical protein